MLSLPIKVCPLSFRTVLCQAPAAAVSCTHWSHPHSPQGHCCSQPGSPSAAPPPASHTNPGFFISSAKGLHMFTKWKDREKTSSTLCSFYYIQPTADQLHWKQKCGEICPKSQGSSLEKPRGAYSLLFSCKHNPNIFLEVLPLKTLEGFY